jgi:DNA polymerase elongation subunit (family B)
MVSFQILDVHSQDRDVTKETEISKEVIYIKREEDENDEVKPRYSPNKSEMVIHLFGTTEEGKSLRVSVIGFEPYFYVELPDKKSENYFKLILKNSLKHRPDVFNSLKIEYVEKQKLYGYTNRKDFPFVKLSVPSLSHFYVLKKVFLNEKNHPIFSIESTLCKVYEANLDPMLRFFHLRNIQPCGWATIEDEYEPTIEVHYEDIHPHNGSTVAPYTIGFWDIECFSANGDFPLAKKDYYKLAKQLHEKALNYSELKDTIIQCIQTPYTPPKDMDGIFLKTPIPPYHKLETILSDTKFQNQIENYFEKEYNLDTLNKILKNNLSKSLPVAGDPAIQIGIVLSTNNKITEQHIFVLNGSDALDGIIVHNYTTERNMILDFIKFLNKKNPDILIGYNVFGFDERYLFERMEELDIHNDDNFQKLSRIEDIVKYDIRKPIVSLQTKFLSSSALGDNNLYIWTTTGRLHIDLYFYIKRIESLSSYKLDDVCRHYMSGKLSGIEIKGDTWLLQTNATKDAEIGKYLVLLDELGDTIVEKRKILDIIPSKGIIIDASDSSFEANDLTTIVMWAIVKDDVSPAELFKLHQNGGTAGRAIVAKYCIQDCVLVQQLFVKLDVFNNAMAMANTCSVPISYIFIRGQGIKCESLIFKECSIRNQLIEVLPTPLQKEDDNYIEESYEGAIVLDPNPSFYAESPIGVADFASLYPSTIISENISYDTLLWSKDYDMSYNFTGYSFGSKEAEKYLTPDVKFTDIEFDIWAPDPNDTRKNPEKLRTGIRICRYTQQPDDKKGSLPDILTKLLAARKSKRKQAEKENDPFKKALLDAEQLAYKLTANSLYGQLGSPTFKVRLQHLAASTTAYGRKQILFAKDVIEKFYGPGANDPRCSVDGAHIVYGDSVAGYTPVIIRRNNIIEIINIEELGDLWNSSDDSDKEFCNLKDVESWTENGWTPIERVIRHKLHPNKKMIRVVTHTAIVDVTDDHSLIKSTGEEISPNDLTIGDELLHHPYPEIKSSDKPSNDEIMRAKIDGFFVGDGSCGYYDCPSGLKASWALNNSDMELLTSYKKMCESVYPDIVWVIMPTLESSGVYKLSPRLANNKRGALLEFIKKYRELYYVGNRKNIPSWILNGHIDIQTAFWNGFYDADGDKDVNGYIRADQKNQSTMAQLAFLASNIGYMVSFNTRLDKPNVYRLTCTKLKQRREPNAIKKLYELSYNGYVYDLTTANHHFQAGVGKMIVHNTDSLFINFNVRNPETQERLQGTEAIEKTMELTEEAGKFVTRCLKKPHDFEYDKVFYPFIIFSKKRYVGNKYEGDSQHYKQTSMGIATKRRDYAGIVKNVYGGAIKILLNEKDVLKAFNFVQSTCNDLVNGKISDHQLTLTKSLRSEYKSPTPPSHKILAERIAIRDPGNAPSSGERLQFMYILPEVGQIASKLQGDRIETPSYIKEHKLKIDYKYYIEHQILNPITQLFGLFVEQLPGYVKPRHILCVEEREKYSGELLFNDIYAKCDNQNVRSFANRFGFTVKESEKKEKTKTVKQISAPVQNKKKQLVNYPKLDRFLIQQYDEEIKKRKDKKKNNDENTIVIEG